MTRLPRWFLGVAAASFALAAGWSSSGSRLAAQEARQSGPCARAAPKVELAGPAEPGQRLVVSGRVFKADGQTPAGNLIVYAYQTDARGLYSEQRGTEPRLKGWAKTDAAGRFELATIKPGAYPGGTEPAHIHLQTWGAGLDPQWHDDILFADDPLVAPTTRARSEALGRFAFVHAPVVRDGTATVSHNVRLKPLGDRFEPSIMHGLEACRR